MTVTVLHPQGFRRMVDIPESRPSRHSGGRSSPAPRWIPLALSAWLLLVGGGTVGLWTWSGTAEAEAVTVEAWPEGSALEHAKDRPTIVMFAHPKCPCTLASYEELSRALTVVERIPLVHLVLVEPEGAAADFQDSTLASRARRDGFCLVQRDRGGALAKQFGARVSGHVLLFSAAGEALFSGGITAARGHEGSNLGVQRLCAGLRGVAPEATRFPVLGCGLFDEEPGR
ncbi:MAG: hypothetical protein RL885_30240 [Planctomycetota bacterium]